MTRRFRRPNRWWVRRTLGPGAVLLAALATGCHTPIGISHAESGLVATGQYDVISGIDLPRVRGVEGCGAQALATAIGFYDDSVDATALADELPWHDYGATPVELLGDATTEAMHDTVDGSVENTFPIAQSRWQSRCKMAAASAKTCCWRYKGGRM